MPSAVTSSAYSTFDRRMEYYNYERLHNIIYQKYLLPKTALVLGIRLGYKKISGEKLSGPEMARDVQRHLRTYKLDDRTYRRDL